MCFPFIEVVYLSALSGEQMATPFLIVKGKKLSVTCTGKPLSITEGDWCSRTAPSESLGRFFQTLSAGENAFPLPCEPVNLALSIPWWNALGAIYSHARRPRSPAYSRQER